ncbi:MAG: glycoside hydrolase family 3 N-terminal domain-containing protein [Woeseiaceae bacterium]|nr:glycoside hydrolase family 3 N-terminal domain-containing protein [Woeseiaceae bacterium]
MRNPGNPHRRAPAFETSPAALICIVACLAAMSSTRADRVDAGQAIDEQVEALLGEMTLAEKIGQMSQVNASDDHPVADLAGRLRAGRVGSVLNVVDPVVVNELQRIAVEESRLGIPLLVGRDVIHGFRTILPIPLGQAATWNPAVVEEGARVAALEAATVGINWTFAPMIDVTRDPRWGRIAESPGEDPFLASRMAEAMVRGFEGKDLTAPGSIAACAKHFAGYGAVEAGRDYATTNIPENELRNVYLPPFKAAVNAGVSTLMASFSDLNGVPATANEFLMRRVLREEWGFGGFVVSDWQSVDQLAVHGLTANDRESAAAAVNAGVDMEMAGDTYVSHLEDLVADGTVDAARIDAAVAAILRLKFELGLFEEPYVESARLPAIASPHALSVAKQAALESVVLLKNENTLLPLDSSSLDSIAVIGPLADAPYEQLGTWIFDGDPDLTVTGLAGLRNLVGNELDVRFVPALETSRSRDTGNFDSALAAARDADAVVLYLGEESILSGEAHSRADIGLPGAQAALVRTIRRAGKPVIAVIMAGRPLTLTDILDGVDALLYAWHPGTMGGAAIADLLFGVESPSGKLPVTFPRMVGQVPIYYGQKNSGKPATPGDAILMDDIPVRAPQTSLGNTSYHLDAGFTPLFEFGYGLSYAEFEYSAPRVSAPELPLGGSVTVSAELTNRGTMAADEVVQLYVRDLVGSVTRPVRELKGFRRVRVQPGQTLTISFDLHSDDLAFYGRDNRLVVEPGEFHIWIGGSSATPLRTELRLVDPG